MPSKTDRTYHRPVSIQVEGIQRMPDERELPASTQMTINLKFNHDSAVRMVLYLLKELLVKNPLDFFFVEVTGPSP